MPLISLIVIAFFMCACAGGVHYTQNVHSWEGHAVGNLIQAWGPATYQVPGTGDNTLYIYQKRAPASPQPMAPSFGTVVTGNRVAIAPVSPDTWYRGGLGLQMYCIATFEVNKNKIIVDSNVRGNGCILLLPPSPQ